MGMAADLVEFVVDPVELFQTRSLVIEHFNHLLAVHHFLGKAFHGSGRALLAHEVLSCAAANDFCDKEHGHNAQNENQRHPDAEVQHNCKNRKHDGA